MARLAYAWLSSTHKEFASRRACHIVADGRGSWLSVAINRPASSSHFIDLTSFSLISTVAACCALSEDKLVNPPIESMIRIAPRAEILDGQITRRHHRRRQG